MKNKEKYWSKPSQKKEQAGWRGGNEKEHYHLRKIKARIKSTEIVWIFFGIHTANALQIGKRIEKQNIKKAA